ncbi:HugZ family protein [Mesorhizobium sp. CGMCC 1.15528]|uniref:HugZ family protein n=1 Tax=Mesorhizobium zhangyense TaxID=1776730 RepID=A0A7C9VHY9_9HYPH|nr:HugZ family protein [Mesorhizobium zhangyense]NGN44851.1 HugZ family protein [Mesorhizobium zhangyense]
METKKDVIRETDAEAITLAKTLIRTARHGAIATLDPETGAPLASRVGTATDVDGTPLILVSLLAAHTRALIADPRCSLLLGQAGKGDPLAHPRISLYCRARQLERGTPAHARAQRRYLNSNPKAELYVGLGDFSFFRLEIDGASLNAGFGKAYNLTPADLLTNSPALEALADSEQSALDHMNSDHLDAIAVYARRYAKAEGDGWIVTGFDADGMDIATGDQIRRVFFPRKLTEAGELRKMLVEMAKSGREADHIRR